MILPVHLQVTMLDPALKGSMNVLKACAKAASVKRVVMTSSSSAIRYDYNRQATDPPLNESVWSNPEYCLEYKVLYYYAQLGGLRTDDWFIPF